MPSAYGIRAGAAYVELSTRDSRFVKGLASAKRRLQAFSASVGDLGAQFMRFSTYAALPFLAGAKVYADFEQQMANVATMLDEPAKYMELYKKRVREMSVEFGESTDALAGGLYDILSASVPAAKALQVLEVAVRAAKAGMTDTKTAADAITTVLNSYGLSADHAGEVSDLLFSIVKRGKCVTGDTRVLLADGRYQRIDSLSGEVEVISWDGRNFTPAKAKWVDMGTKRTVRLRTSFGREITTTPEHPYLTPSGWRPVELLRPGDRIALPVSLPVWGNVEAEAGWPSLLGYLIAEGSIQAGSPRVATSLDTVRADLERSAALLSVSVHRVNQRDPAKCQVYSLVAGPRGSKPGSNPVIEMLRRTGLWGVHCRDKFIPDECFRWRKQDVAQLLRALFTGDGWLCKSGRGFQLGYCSISKRLVDDISHLLLRFGIVMRIRKTSIDAWTLTTRRHLDIKRFVDFIGIERDTVADFRRWEPAPAQARLRHLTSYGKTSSQERTRYRECSGVRDFDQPIFFDRIIEIQPGEVEKVYDLTVPVLHNFVANDIVAHNTTFSELAPAIGNVANIANTAGISLEEMGAVIAMLTRNGIKTREAITSLRGIIVAFLKPSDEAAKMAKQLGFELNAATLQSEGLAGILQKLASLPPDALAKLFPNVEGLKGILPILRNMAGFSEDLAAMGNRAGATEAAFLKMTSTLTHAFNQLKQGAIAVLSVLGEAIAEPLSAAIGWIKRYALMAQEMIQNNRDVVTGVLKVIGVIGGLGAALIAVAVAGKTLAFVIGGIGAIVSTVTGLFGFMASAIGAMLSPIGLVITGLAALAAYLIYATGTGAKALEWLGSKFQILRDFALRSWQGIADAMAAGDMTLAVKVAWLSIQVAWRTGINTLKGWWLDFKEFFSKTMTDAFYGAVVLVADAFYGLQSIWEEVTYAMANAWTVFSEAIQFGWRSVQNDLEKGLYDIIALYKKHKTLFTAFAPGVAAALELSGFSEIDTDQAKKSADKQFSRDADQLADERVTTLIEREKAHKQRVQEIQEEKNGTLKAISDMADAEDNARRVKYDKERQDSEAALKKAKQDWQDAVDEARQKREAFDAGSDGPESVEKPDLEQPDIAKKLAASLQNVGAEVEKMVFDIVGTFDANALRGIGLGQNTTQERTAKAAEDTAKNTKRMADKMDDAEGLVFE